MKLIVLQKRTQSGTNKDNMKVMPVAKREINELTNMKT